MLNHIYLLVSYNHKLRYKCVLQKQTCETTNKTNFATGFGVFAPQSLQQ